MIRSWTSCILFTIALFTVSLEASHSSFKKSHARKSLLRHNDIVHVHRENSSVQRRQDCDPLDLSCIASSLGLGGPQDNPLNDSDPNNPPNSAPPPPIPSDTSTPTDSSTPTDTSTDTSGSTDSATATDSSDPSTTSTGGPGPISASDSGASSATITSAPPSSTSGGLLDDITSGIGNLVGDNGTTTSDSSGSTDSSTPTSTADSDGSTSTSTADSDGSTSTSSADSGGSTSTSTADDGSQTTSNPPTSNTPTSIDGSGPSTSNTPTSTADDNSNPTTSDTPQTTDTGGNVLSSIIGGITSNLLPTTTVDLPQSTNGPQSVPQSTDGPQTTDQPPPTSIGPTGTVTQSGDNNQPTTTGGDQATVTPPPFTSLPPQSTADTQSVYFPTGSISNSAEAESLSSVLQSMATASGELQPQTSLSMDQDGETAATTATIEQSASLPSAFAYVTQSSLELDMVAATSATVTLTNPDAVASTLSNYLTQSNTAAPTQIQALPDSLPAQIMDTTNPIDPNSPNLAGYTLVAIKFLPTLDWPYVATNTQTAAMLFGYMPQLLQFALGATSDQIKTYCLQAFAPATYNSNDPTSLSTLWLAFITNDLAPVLQSQILTTNSPMYSESTGIPQQIADQIDASFPINSVTVDTVVSGGVAGSSAPTASSAIGNATAASRRDAIIGVCAVFGAVLIGVAVWWGVKTWKRQQDVAHRRLTYNSADMHQAGGYGATSYQPQYQPAAQFGGYDNPHSPMYPGVGAAMLTANPPGQQEVDPFADQSSVEGDRRRSFFFAEDSLRGYAMPREEEDGITYSQMMREQQGHLSPNEQPRKAPIQTSAISAPILRESSLNW